MRVRLNRGGGAGSRHYASFSYLPQFMVAFFGILLILMYVIGFKISGQLSHSEENNNPMTALIETSTSTTTLRSIQEQQQQHDASATGGSLQGSTSCLEARNKVASGEWVDPNDGKIYARQTVSQPSFRISLHNKEYDPVRWRIMEEGRYYEDEVHDRFVQILSQDENSLVLDVGANIGYYTLLSLALQHKVISFEPNPANLLRLCDSLRLNDFRDASIFQNAVGNTHGETMTLHAPRNPGQGFLKPVEPGDEETNIHKAKTTVVSLDKFAQEQGWFTTKPNISILKVDVEGKDPYVILGAAKLLKSGMVQNVLMECRRFGRPAVSEMLVVLLDAGFVLVEPKVDDLSFKISNEDKAKAIVDWAFATLGHNSQENVDMWWTTTRENY